MRKTMLFSAILAMSFAASGALAQSAGGTGGGMNSNSRSMSGPNIDVDNGIMANGTPKQQSPGVSMTNGPANAGAPSATLNGDGTPQPGGPAALPAPREPAPTGPAPGAASSGQ
jgi:hypothetical protein